MSEPYQPRIIAWFSCGIPSAVSAKVCLEEFGANRVTVANCDSKPSEHPDNYRFFKQVEAWLGVPILELRSNEYETVDAVFEKTRYMSGLRGARCTTELKKIPRLKFAMPDDIHVFGYTSGEKKRAREFEARNPDMVLRWMLIEKKLSRGACFRMMRAAGIREPMMYELGFDNNNCPGCVKAQSPWYWMMIRIHFPEVFANRCRQSREIGCRLVKVSKQVEWALGRLGKLDIIVDDRIFLDELPEGTYSKSERKENMSCGPECGIQTNLFT